VPRFNKRCPILALRHEERPRRELKGVGRCRFEIVPSPVREYRGKRNLITDFCDKARSSVPRPARNKWGEAACAGRSLPARGSARRIGPRITAVLEFYHCAGNERRNNNAIYRLKSALCITIYTPRT